jgi:endonuclease YncB( thermonuclease family)
MRTICLLFTLFSVGVFAEEPAAAEVSADGATAAAGEENDETKQLLKQLTIAMISEVIDERTVVIRDANAKGAKKTIHLRLGNTVLPPKGSLDDGEYAEKVKVSKEALTKLVDKQMVWYKAAPDAHQGAASDDGTPDVVIADVWTIDGKHITSTMTKEGHLGEEKVYDEELAKDILTVAAEVEKKDSYKKLEEALKESEKAKKEIAAAQRKEQQAQEDAENVEPFNLGGWLAVAVLGLLVLGAATNFGRESNKKVNLNRKKGFFEKFWMKLKGA